MMTYHYRQLIDFLDWKVDLAQHIILAPSLHKHRKPEKREKKGNLENVEKKVNLLKLVFPVVTLLFFSLVDKSPTLPP